MDHTQGILQRVVGWLRAGYPEGVPAGDYVALLGVLRRKLTEEDIEAIVAELGADRPEPISREEIRELIRAHALQEPSKKDVARVSARLEAVGWELGDGEGDGDGQTDGPAAGA
ncbi:DUF3349 domain-containing protein [Ornithinimicrobium tianjinense]|uniref:DUF3349 domain-containing protein n=1 Tax=Ornithinimicrobium tianjinense TaxID=1195761 RepID=A0A917BTY1_9MICO|nr:DUF3349 domain-containing protein [Ornithinimicrobium tianjinense]GGF56684.1 hypothetical protein GCM10011366_25690 [Ornithinimicrobium tianjinense]